ncbi:MAG: hypothetical protein IID40_08920 [Planctomycetes bacterium]|nr:hypothetical protein [Planctomycetota bacterium]
MPTRSPSPKPKRRHRESAPAGRRTARRIFILGNPRKGAGPDGVSPLFDWFAGDFIEDAGSVDQFIEGHRDEGLVEVNTASFLAYDWSLNIAPD